MALRDTLQGVLGSAWHVASKAFFIAMLPATDGTVEAGKVVTAADSTGSITLPTGANLTLQGTGGIVLGTGGITRTETYLIPMAGKAKLGGSGAGWVIDGDTALPFVTLAADQTSEVLLVPIDGLKVGDTVTSVGVVGQIESAGGTVAGTLDVRKATAAAADYTDASLATDTISVTADTLIGISNLGVTGLTEVIAATEQLYVTITMTTGSSTDVVLTHLVVVVTRA